MEVRGTGLCGIGGAVDGVRVLADLLNGRLGVDCWASWTDDAGVEES